MTLAFDHGRDLPLRAELADGIQAILADITGLDTTTPTKYGPVLRQVSRIPLSVQALLSSKQGHDMIEEIVSRVSLPGALIYIGKRERKRQDRIGPIPISEEFECHLYLIAVHAAADIPGRVEPNDVDDRKPGLDAIEDLVVPRLDRNSPVGWQEFKLGFVDDVWATPGYSVRDVVFSATVEYESCKPRDPEQIETIKADHDVQDGGVIAEQEYTISV